jgi:hypothetical protein
MPVKGSQLVGPMGSHWLVQRKDVLDEDGIEIPQPWIDLGTVRGQAPDRQTTEIELKDARFGKKQTVASVITEDTETLKVQVYNFAPNNWPLLRSAKPAAEYTASATPVTDVKHVAHVGFQLKLKNPDGSYVYNLASIQAITAVDGGASLVEGTDWEWVDKIAGVIKILSGTTVVEDGDEILIDFTRNAMSGKRLIYPLTENKPSVRLISITAVGDYEHVFFREAEADLSVDSEDHNEDDFASFVLSARITSDINETLAPAGRVLYYGDMPLNG